MKYIKANTQQKYQQCAFAIEMNRSGMCTRSCLTKLMLLIAIAAITLKEGATTEECAGIGEYCQNHWECCSNSCASFLYRCTRSYNNTNNIFLASFSKQPPASNYDDILATHFGNAATLMPVTQPAIAVRVQHDEIVESEAATPQPTTTTTPPATTEEELETTTAAVTTETIAETSSYDMSMVENISNYTTTKESEQNLPAETTTIASNNIDDFDVTYRATFEKCQKIGSKCYTNADCCNRRCHGYLHQCVT